ncbi:MAG: hypothetical protein EXR50_03650 [Dehalococcoidia bacterium]|nr:hypothetical protein [Dehalococcoidia bacterium]
MLFVPPAASEQLDGFAEHFGTPADGGFFSRVFSMHEYQPNVPFTIGQLTVETSPVVHYVPSFAVAISGDKKVVFSSDTGPCEELVRFASGADVLVTEATDSSDEEIAA